MNIVFTDESWEDYIYLHKNAKKILKRINQLIKETQKTPFDGTGKPEPLKFQLSGCWSRRINSEHRLVYKVTNENFIILSCRYHY